jgi:hypothetical protein
MAANLAALMPAPSKAVSISCRLPSGVRTHPRLSCLRISPADNNDAVDVIASRLRHLHYLRQVVLGATLTKERPPLLTNLRRKSATCEGLENWESASACECEIRTRAVLVQNGDDTASLQWLSGHYRAKYQKRCMRDGIFGYENDEFPGVGAASRRESPFVCDSHSLAKSVIQVIRNWPSMQDGLICVPEG